VREVKEELGLDREPAACWPLTGSRRVLVAARVSFAVFDGGRLTAEEIGETAADELRAFAFLPTDEAVQALPESLARRP
jgi:8-oxo-dGTP pyrophosphatase MutT (NUDIX family)